MNVMVNPRAGIGHNAPPSLPDEVREHLRNAYASLAAQAASMAAVPLPATVDSDDAAADVTAIGKSANDLLKKIDASRTDEKEPYLSAGRAVDEHFKALNVVLAPFVGQCRKLIDDWQTKKRNAERERLAAEARVAAAEAERKAAEALASMKNADIQEAGRAAEAATIAERAAQAPAAVLSRVVEGGKVVASGSVHWKHEVIDASLVPRAYCSPDDAKLKAALALGVREIPGVRIYEASRVAFR